MWAKWEGLIPQIPISCYSLFYQAWDQESCWNWFERASREGAVWAKWEGLIP
jgi:hypothetical protein